VRAVQAEIVFAHTPSYPEEPPLIKARRCVIHQRMLRLDCCAGRQVDSSFSCRRAPLSCVWSRHVSARTMYGVVKHCCCGLWQPVSPDNHRQPDIGSDGRQAV